MKVASMLGMIGLAGAAGAMDNSSSVSPPPQVVDVYHGVSVTDPYRWLENGADPRVKAWSTAEDARTRKYIDSLPVRKPIYDRLFKQISATSSSYRQLHAVGDRLFALYNQPPKQQPMIAILSNAADPALAKIIVDPNAIDSQGTTAIDWFVPSPDGKWVAVSMSRNGSEDGTLHTFEVATGKEVDAQIPRVQYPTAGGSLAWRADSKAFWYTRYPGSDRPAEEQHFYQQIYFHKLGEDPARDNYVLGKDFPKVAEIILDTRFNPDILVVSVANGDGGEYAHYLIEPDQGIHQITRFEDKVVAATVGADASVYLVSRQGAARGRLLKLEPGVFDLKRASVIVAESEAVIQGGGEFGGEPIVVTPTSLYIREIIGGPSRVLIVDHSGKPKGSLPLPDVAAVDEVEALNDGTVLYSVATYLRPAHYERYAEGTGASSETKLTEVSPVSFEDTEVVRELVRSKDGTSIPINIIRRKGTPLNGANPLLLYGYGGYNVSETPYFLGPSTRLWLDAGGVFVIVNLRGGGEFGETWHLQGSLTHKQNVFDDFIASAEQLITEGYTRKDKLAIRGGSNGGLLMGAVLTQRPELFRAVVSQVGIYDMLRVELDPNGMFNTTEFGTVKDADQFKALYAYSPYHHVVPGVAYPAIFMATGETDGRVNPAHSRKMIARLQAATSSSNPVLLSINSHAGHGIGSALSIRVSQTADWMAFLFAQLGMGMPVS